MRFSILLIDKWILRLLPTIILFTTIPKISRIYITIATVWILISRKKIKISSIKFFLFFFILAILTTKILNPTLYNSIEHLNNWFFGSVIIFLIYELLNRENVNDLLGSLYYLSIFILIIAIFEMITGRYYFVKTPHFIGIKGNLGLFYNLTTFYNINNICYFLVLSIPLGVYYNIIKQKSKIILFLMIVLSFVICINNDSKLGLICLILSWLGYVSMYSFRLLNYKSIINSYFITFGILGIISVFPKIIQFMSSEAFFTERFDILTNSLKQSKEYILFGRGLGVNEHVYGIPPHNIFIQCLTEMGIFTLAPFLCMIVICIYNLMKNSKVSKLNYLLVSMIIVFSLSNMIPSGAEKEFVTWLFLGICIGYTWIKPSDL